MVRRLEQGAVKPHVKGAAATAAMWALGLCAGYILAPIGVRATVQHYSMVLAATCQQSVSREMESIKGCDETIFRTVVIDGAARANPLDLLIPMAIAER